MKNKKTKQKIEKKQNKSKLMSKEMGLLMQGMHQLQREQWKKQNEAKEKSSLKKEK